MYLGPFWCEEQKLWLRLNIQKSGSCRAEIATEYNMYSEWVTVNDGYWITNAELKIKVSPNSLEMEDYSLTATNHGFYLHEGTLYKANWHKSSYSQGQFEMSKLMTDSQFVLIPPGSLKDNPFIGIATPKPIPLPLLSELPPTPEMQPTRLESWQKAFRRRSLVSQVSLISELPRLNKKLKDLNKKEEIFYDYCGSRLFEVLAPELFANPSSYLATLETITDETSDLYQSLKYIAAQTAFDRETGLNPNNKDSEIRQHLYVSKLHYLLDLVSAERASLLQDFHLPVTPLIYPLPIILPKEVEQPVNKSNEDKMEEFEPIDEWSLESNVFANPDYEGTFPEQALPNISARHELPVTVDLSRQEEAIETLTEEEQIQYAINLSQGTESKEELHKLDAPLDETLVDESILSAIKEAVIRAVIKYQEWYFNDDKDIRSNGFFSRWSYNENGQQRALEVNDKVQAVANSADAIEIIYEFLNDSKSGYRRHSFSSFLLNELKNIPNENLPWSDLDDKARNSLCF
ncbi:hypothetical protein ACQUW5_11985 [Legionella sp. CNM-1927-20]|uniref:hypothetical protein n=1 Tax=Legionella sp. CNM-1927-20 TaxID=3422221 RepID=UPI00403ADAC5